MRTSAPAGARRSFRLLAWAAAPVLALAGTVQVTGAGIDILLLAVAGLLLFAFERSVGDLLGEWFGPLASATIMVVVAVALSWYFLSESLGRSRTDRFFAEAERRGYRTVYYQRAESTADEPAGGSTPAGGVTTSADKGKAVEVATSTSGSQPASARQATSADPSDDTTDRGAPAAAPSTAATPQKERAATRAIRSFFRRNVVPTDPIATDVALTVTPSRVTAAHRVVITATVRSGGEPVNWGTVEFTVNGLGAGRASLNSQGVATTTFQTHMTGTYEVRARFAGSPEYASSRSTPVVFSVVGGR